MMNSINDFALKGLRTLLFAKRVISEETFNELILEFTETNKFRKEGYNKEEQ